MSWITSDTTHTGYSWPPGNVGELSGNAQCKKHYKESRSEQHSPGSVLPLAQASVLLWAGNCLEVSAEGDKAKLQDVRACSEAKGVPVVLVEDTKRLGEWVGVRRSLSVTPVLPHSMAHITRMDGRMLCRPVLVPDDALGHSPDIRYASRRAGCLCSWARLGGGGPPLACWQWCWTQKAAMRLLHWLLCSALSPRCAFVRPPGQSLCNWCIH